MRLAWIGEAASGGGVPGLCRIFLQELAKSEVELDWYCRGTFDSIPELARLNSVKNVRIFSFPFHWNWDSWYGRNPKAAFLLGIQRRVAAFKTLSTELLRHNRERPYDAVLQFSQAELFGLKHHTRELGLVLFPCVHAAGELQWCRAEEHLAKICEPWWWRRARLLQLSLRARIQKRDYTAAVGVIGLSRKFNGLIARDYGLDERKLGVVYHPIETEKMRHDKREPCGNVKLLFVGRVSVRKGIDVLRDALPQILAADPRVEVTLIGEGAQWSNYETLLASLPKERCRWLKGLSNIKVIEEMEQSDILLVPSSYEPGGIVVGEALACGMITACSDEVGSAEDLPEEMRWRYPAKNVKALIDAVKGAVALVRGQGPGLRRRARQIADEQFSPSGATTRLVLELQRLVGAR